MSTNQKTLNEYEYEGIKLKDIFSTIWKMRYLLIWVSILVSLIVFIAGFFYSRSQSRTVAIVEFQWDGISSGLYPNGQRFDYGSAITSIVINEAINQMGTVELSVNDVKSAMHINSIIPKDTLELIENSLIRGITYTFHPTNFRITLDHSELGISREIAQSLLDKMILLFREDFEKTYLDYMEVIDYTKQDLESLDYIDSYEVLKLQIELMRNAIDEIMPQATNFVSVTTGYGFNSTLARINLVSQIELFNISTRINNFLLTKDKDLLISRYLYTLELLELDLIREQSVQSSLNDLISNYVGGTNTIIIPGLDPALIPNTDPYLNQLYANLVSSQSLSASIERDINLYETKINRLRGEDPIFTLSPEEELLEISRLEVNINDAVIELRDILDDLNIMLGEYNTIETGSVIKYILGPSYQPGISMLIIALGSVGIGILFGITTVFVYDISKKKKISLLSEPN